MGLILYGAGFNAQKFFFSFENRSEISFVIDNSKTYFNENVEVYTLDAALGCLNNQLILVAAEWESYLSIKHELEEHGLHEFTDFIPAELYNKKMVLLHGNCYMDAYEEYLRKSRCFKSRYFIYKIPQIHLNSEKKVPEELLANCNLFIHQDIKADNPYSEELSDIVLLPKLNKDCKVVTVPNLVGYGRWCFPHIDNAHKAQREKSSLYMMFGYNYVLEEIFENNFNMALGEVVQRYLTYSTENIKDIWASFDYQIGRIKEREKCWDIKVSNYILEHYKNEKLFMDSYHIAPKFMRYICCELGHLLELEDADDVIISKVYDETEEFVPISVKQALQLEWDDMIIRNNYIGGNKLVVDKPMDIKEYVKEYLYWWHDIVIE